MTDREIYEKAQKRVKEKKDFYSHLSSYVITMVFLLFLNLFTAPGYLWVIWPAMGWGIGLAFHAFSVFGIFGNQDDDWEERELKKEIERLKRKKKDLPESADDEMLLDEDPLELKELKKERADWDDKDFV
jgi:hypothetical protein